jgi:hypothetical protein
MKDPNGFLGNFENPHPGTFISAASISNVPLMVHHTNSGIPLESTSSECLACPESLRPGTTSSFLIFNLIVLQNGYG